MMTLGDLKTYFATATVNQSLRGSGSLMGKFVHWVLIDIYNCADFWWNNDSDTFSTSNGTAVYFLNNRVSLDKVWSMQDQTNGNPLFKKDLSLFYALDPTPTDTGTPMFWAYVKQAEVFAAMPSSTTLSFVSSNASDTSVNIVIRGKSGGVDLYEIKQINGTNSVSTSIAWDSGAILSISLQNQTLGVVTFTAGSTTIAQIPPGHLRVQHSQIRLFNVPAGTYTIQYHYYKRSVPLVNDSEIVDLPDIGFKALRYGIEEIAHFLNSKFQESAAASEKFKEAKEELISISERDVAGNELKGRNNHLPFSVRLPDFIDGSVLL